MIRSAADVNVGKVHPAQYGPEDASECCALGPLVKLVSFWHCFRASKIRPFRSKDSRDQTLRFNRMISAIVGVIIAFNALVYLVLAAFLKDRERKPSQVHFPELTGLITKGDKKVTWARARSSLAAQSLFSSQPQGLLRRVTSLCSPRASREELPLYSIDCTDFKPCRGNGLFKVQSWPPDACTGRPAPGLLPPLGRAAAAHRVLDSTPTATAPSTAISAAPPMTSAKALTLSLMSAEKPTTESTALAPPANEDGNADADTAEGLLRQALRMLYKQHYGVPSVMAHDKQPHQEDSQHCFLERQHSPKSPLDATDSLPISPPVDGLATSPFYGFSPSESVCSDSVNGDIDEDPAAAAGLPELPPLGSCANSGAAPDLALQPPQSVFIVSTWRLRNE
ncbi:hypothetical protein COCOBI_19-0660 [Coccomyxa sp. Obi]|nr:hypothetical protein COCOBI_19-0660 [Coccomyxa sp. Obi]